MIALPQAAPAAAPIAVRADAAPVAAPILDRRYRLDSEEVHTSGTRRWQFTQATDLVFRRDGTGLAVEMTLVDLHAEPADATAARFMVGQGAMRGLVIRLHLDAAGRLVSIEDEDRVWAQLIAGIDAMADRSPSQTLPLARDPAAPLRALPPEARLRMIASDCLTALPPSLPIGVRSIKLPGDGGGAATLPGTETVALRDGVIRDETKAYGAAEEQGQSVTRIRRIDAATGLLIDSSEDRTIRIGDRIVTIEKRTHLYPVP